MKIFQKIGSGSNRVALQKISILSLVVCCVSILVHISVIFLPFSWAFDVWRHFYYYGGDLVAQFIGVYPYYYSERFLSGIIRESDKPVVELIIATIVQLISVYFLILPLLAEKQNASSGRHLWLRWSNYLRFRWVLRVLGLVPYMISVASTDYTSKILSVVLAICLYATVMIVGLIIDGVLLVITMNRFKEKREQEANEVRMRGNELGYP